MAYSALLGLIGWSFIPRTATQYALNFFHKFYPQITHRSPPAPGTPAYVQHYRYTYAVVVLGYLLYTLISGSTNMAPNFYEILGVAPDVDENGLKLAFRRFAKLYHPDRVGAQGAELFMSTRDMFEALKNPTVRFAYDRFGPGVLEWSKLSTLREYLHHGLLQSAGYHIVTALGLVIVSALGRESPVRFWRYVLFVVFSASELAYVLYPSPSSVSVFSSAFWDPVNGGSHPTVLHILFPQRVAYQHILFLHHMFFFCSLALTQVAPQLFPDATRDEQRMVLQQITNLAAYSDREASVMLHNELHSIHPSNPGTRISTTQMQPMLKTSPDIMDLLTEEMENMIIETNIKQNSGPLLNLWETAIVRQRARSEAPQLHIPKGRGDGSPSSACEGEGKLPSPRPSPPPSVRRNSSYVRARSVSWS